ncbi:zinc ribbon domain-containing protein [Pseudoflavonifractor sp. 60]|uniref:zinc ribbon domain-containing protein n=1 Tax=Pseudoflavonifractor sp. 60 TaxID=2304576 RepID=UPI0013717F89|nr:zinc ribbon domain-containing protein [Pseudoflavonifractor sp. 60]NBI68756.1 zinc ribbon domain-containing protein [Pseudoflavonifractor sp. 60]
MDDKVKALLERVKGTANYAADAAADGARAAGKRAGQMVDVAKLNVQLFDLNGEYNDLLRELGQVMYSTHLGQAADPEQVTALLAQADEKSGRIAELKGRISDLRQSQTCPGCGAPCGKSDKFCRACGAQL